MGKHNASGIKSSRTRITLFALTAALAHTPLAHAQPVVNGSSGTWSYQATVTVSGSGFGSKSTAAPVVWDDASGASIGSKWDGAWPSCGPSPLAYRTPAQVGRGIPLPHSHITKYISGAHAGSGANCGYNVIMFKTRTVSLPAYTYATWYERVDDNWTFGDDDNFKTFAYSVGTTPYELPNNWYVEYNPRPTSRTSGAAYHINDDGASLQTPDVNGHSWWWAGAINPMAGAWKKIEMELRYTNATDGYIKLWENGVLKIDYRGRTDNLAGTTRTEGIGGYARNYNIAGNWRYFADVYLDYSRARVILGNAPTLAASTRREVQVPSSWSASSITLSANLGTFAGGQTAYVYVFDANGTSNATGWPVTIGTGAPPPPGDTTPPSVTATSPANGASGVAATATVTVTLNEPIDASTITTATLQVRNPSNALVTSAVSYDAATNRAVLTHAAPFAASTIYTATLKGGSGGVKDAAGNLLPSDYSWSFTTAAAVPPPTGQLVAAYAFGENTGTTVADASGTNNTGTITGATWTASGKYGTGLSFNGTNAWVTANTASSLALPNAMTLEAWIYPTALSGWQTVLMKETGTGLAYTLYANDNAPWPATYVRMTGASVSAGAAGAAAVPLNTWTHLASTYNGSAITLYVNGTAVSTKPATGTVTTSMGPLHIGGNGIWGEFFTGLIDEVRIYSRALSAAEIQADMATPIVVPDTTPPTVTAATPAGGATGVATATSVTVTFNEAMNAASVTASSFELRNAAGTLVPAAVGYNTGARLATLTPSSPLAFNATYTAIVKGSAGGVRDAAGNALAANYTWSFTTVPPPDTMAPTVSSVSPANGATGAPVSSFVYVTFSEAMNSATISTSTIELRNASNALVTATVNFDSNARMATLIPSSDLSNNQTYTVTVKSGASGVKDAAGNALASTFTSFFTTVAAPQPEGLVASYAFDENGGTIAADDSGNNHTGTIAGATWTVGRFGAGLEFNGATAWVTVPHAAPLALTTAMTLEAWVYPRALSGWNTVIMKERSSGLAYALYANDNSPKPAAYVRLDGASGSNGTSGPAPLALNTWTHLAATYDGATLTLVVNGTYTYRYPTSGLMASSSGPLRIGGNALWGEYFTGVIDEVRVYNRALSMTEIQADMGTPIGGSAVVSRAVESRQFSGARAGIRPAPAPTRR